MYTMQVICTNCIQNTANSSHMVLSSQANLRRVTVTADVLHADSPPNTNPNPKT